MKNNNTNGKLNFRRELIIFSLARAGLLSSVREEFKVICWLQAAYGVVLLNPYNKNDLLMCDSQIARKENSENKIDSVQ